MASRQSVGFRQGSQFGVCGSSLGLFWTLTQRPCLGCQSLLDAVSHLQQVGHMHLIHEE